VAFYDAVVSISTLYNSGNGYQHTGSETNLVSVWHFNGDLKDYDATNSNDGTFVGGSSNGLWDGANAKLGSGCFYGDGTNDYVDCGNSANLNPTTAITVEAWVNAASISGSQNIINKC